MKSIEIDKNQTGQKTYGTWTVDENGNMTHKGYYHITARELDKRDLLLHLSSKSWIDWNSFLPAYFQALYNAGRTHCHQFVSYDSFHQKFI